MVPTKRLSTIYEDINVNEVKKRAATVGCGRGLEQSFAIGLSISEYNPPG
jgi:hypothetical protein